MARDIGVTYAGQTTRKFANKFFNDAIESSPLSTMAKGHEIFFLLYEGLFWLVAKRLLVVEPASKTAVVTL